MKLSNCCNEEGNSIMDHVGISYREAGICPECKEHCEYVEEEEEEFVNPYLLHGEELERAVKARMAQ
jgi:hypothetical protein